MTKRKKKPVYQEPRITRIPLDPEQAILQQCKVGGVYFNATGKCLYFAGTPVTSTGTCTFTLRGIGSGSGSTGNSASDAQPS